MLSNNEKIKREEDNLVKNRLTALSGNAASKSALGKTAEATADTVTLTRYHNTNANFLPEMLKLSRVNPDLIGWLHIDGVVNLPVVYRDNEILSRAGGPGGCVVIRLTAAQLSAPP